MNTNYDYVKKWYGIKLPRSFNEFISWGINSREIIKHIVGNDVKVVLAEEFNPYTDYDHHSNMYEINLPYIMFHPNYYDEFNIPYWDKLCAAISMYNAFCLHEATHARIFMDLSYKPIGKIIEEFISNKSFSEDFKIYFSEFMKCANLVEDLYVWLYDQKNYPAINVFADITYDIITKEEKLIEFEDNIIPNDRILEYLYLWRNPKIRDYPVFASIQKYIDILSKVNIDTTHNERLEISLELLKSLPQTTRNQEINEFIPEFSEDYLEDEKPETFKKINELIAEVQENIKRIISEENILIDYENSSDFAPDKIEVEYKYVGELDNHEFKRLGNFSLDTKWNSLISVLRLKGQQKTKFALPQKTGIEMMPDELYRLNTDVKIFGNRSSFKRIKQKPEIILLLDFSGSMGNLVVDLAEETYNLVTLLIQQGYSISVFAHTTLGRRSLVVGIYSNILKLEKNSNRLSLKDSLQYSINSIRQSENADGIAIRYVSEKFTHSNRPKLLIVMSDGQPSAEYYYTSDAKGHTRNEAIKLRQKGIKVMSVSLVENVIETNNEIYGKENNIYAENIENQMIKLANILA